MARNARAGARPSVQSAIRGVGRRITRARLEFAEQTHQKVSQEQFGLYVGRALGYPKGITGATVSRWEAEETLPDLITIAAIAMLAGVDPGWLAYGTRSKSPSPDQPSGNSEYDAYRRASIEIGLAEQRTVEADKRNNAIMRDYDKRFKQNLREQRVARGIKDPVERDRRVAEALAQFEALTQELDVRIEEAAQQLGEAADVPLSTERERGTP